MTVVEPSTAGAQQCRPWRPLHPLASSQSFVGRYVAPFSEAALRRYNLQLAAAALRCHEGNAQLAHIASTRCCCPAFSHGLRCAAAAAARPCGA